MLQLNLKSIMMKRNIANPKRFLINRAGINHIMVSKLLNGNVTLLRISHLETICTLLRCTPDELFEWAPQINETPLPENHPLLKLSDRKDEMEFLSKISAMSFEELREAMKKINSTD